MKDIYSKRNIKAISKILLFSLIIVGEILLAQHKINKWRRLSEVEESPTVNQDSCVKNYDKPIPVEWTGKVIALFVSGTQYGIEKIPADTENPYFYAYQDVDTTKYVDYQGVVKIKGNATGITDAYYNSMFGGCVEEVEIVSMEKL